MLDHTWERSLGYCPYEEKDWFTLQGKVADARTVLEAELSDCSSPTRRSEIFRELNRLTTHRVEIDQLCSEEPVNELVDVKPVELMLGGVRERVSNGLNWVTPAWTVSGMADHSVSEGSDS